MRAPTQRLPRWEGFATAQGLETSQSPQESHLPSCRSPDPIRHLSSLPQAHGFVDTWYGDGRLGALATMHPPLPTPKALDRCAQDEPEACTGTHLLTQ